MKIKYFSFLILIVGSLLIGNSLLFYSKGFIGQILLEKAWNETKSTQKNTKPWSWSNTHPVGRLIIPFINFDHIIIEGASNGSLEYGSGHIYGTALPNMNGNCVIAGHRDWFFSGLEKLSEGDQIILESKTTVVNYIISSIHIVNPTDTKWLHQYDYTELTLITCYPFKYIGDAPLRYVIKSEKLNSTQI
jgi:sortase A